LPSWEEEQPEEKEDPVMTVKEVRRVKTDQKAENDDADSTSKAARFLFGVSNKSELEEMIDGLE
jgi:hypothetical protein